MTIQSKEAFAEFSESYWKERKNPMAFGIGIATTNQKGEALDVFYPLPNFRTNFGTAAVLGEIVNYYNGSFIAKLSDDHLRKALEYFTPFLNDGQQHGNIEVIKAILNENRYSNRSIIVCFIGEEVEPIFVEDVYLRLHLISHRLVKPRELNLNGAFNLLPNVAWTSIGPVDLDELPGIQMKMRLRGEHLRVFNVDKFPNMFDYHVPSGIRTAERFRLGAYMGKGTTWMSAASCNFDAGAEGPNMIEGRVSNKVFIKKGSDLGGGSSTIGTLSGGGKEVVTIGENCLVGANGGIGFSLGDFCVVEAGLVALPTIDYRIVRGEYFDEVAEKMKVEKDVDLRVNKFIKGEKLSGISKSTFWRNNVSGIIEAVVGRPNPYKLNEMLHKN